MKVFILPDFEVSNCSWETLADLIVPPAVFERAKREVQLELALFVPFFHLAECKSVYENRSLRTFQLWGVASTLTSGASPLPSGFFTQPGSGNRRKKRILGDTRQVSI